MMNATGLFRLTMISFLMYRLKLEEQEDWDMTGVRMLSRGPIRKDRNLRMLLKVILQVEVNWLLLICYLSTGKTYGVM